MFAIVLVSVLAACAAAPPYHSHPPFYPNGAFDLAPRPHHYDPFAGDVFDTRQFWSEMANELRELDNILADFSKNFPSVKSTQGVEGHTYVFNIPLNGFDEKDIIVKAREGLLMVQAVHRLEGGVIGQRTYMDIKTLPANVNVTGSWTFQNNMLKIVFPLKGEEEAETVDVAASEMPVTEGYSREDMEPGHHGEEGDADVGAGRGDSDKEGELFTNEIPRNSVEATTYAVDLKDEVEFVPVRYR